MNRVLRLVLSTTVISVSTVAIAASQSARIGLDGGLVTPLSDYKEVDKTGWLANANVDFAIPMSPFDIRVDGAYGQTTHKDQLGSPVDGKTKLIGGLASVVWKIPVPAPMVKPYVVAGGGVYNVKTTVTNSVPPVDTSSSKFAYGLGAGVNVGVGPAHIFAEGRYMSVQTDPKRTFVPLVVGVNFGSK